MKRQILAKFSYNSAREFVRGPGWLRYAFALLTSAVFILLELLMNRLTGQPIYPFFPSFAAILVSLALAGIGPGLVSTFLLSIWCAIVLLHDGHTQLDVIVRCSMLVLEGILLSIGKARLTRFARVAADSDAWHRQLVETASEGIWVCDSLGVITYANRQIAAMLGLTIEQIRGRSAESFFFPEDVPVERIRAANLQTGLKEQFDRRLRRAPQHPAGEELWVLACCNVMVDAEGKSCGWLAMMTDITERKRAEHALRRSESRFRHLFEGVLEGVYQSTPDGRIMAANPMLLSMLGLRSESELNDVNIARDLYVDPGTRRRLLAQLEHECGLRNAEYELRTRDGRIITVLENARVVRDEKGVVLYYEGTLTDITEKKRTEEQLRRAQKAEAAGRLVAGIAHDFSHVLTIVTGYAELTLAELPPGHPARESAERMASTAESAMALARQLLSFSRKQTGRFDLSLAVERCEKALAKRTAREVTLHLADQPLLVQASFDEIEHIVTSIADGMQQVQLRTLHVDLNADFCRRFLDVLPGPYAVLILGSGSLDHSLDPKLEPFEILRPDQTEAQGLAAAHAIILQRDGFIARNQHNARYVFLPLASAPAPTRA